MVGLPEDVDLTHLEVKDIHPGWATKRVLEEGIPTVLRQGYWQGETALRNMNDGYEIPVSQLLLLHRDESAVPRQLSTIMRDITSSKQIEQSLRNESDKNQTFLRNASDGITILDYDGNLIEASDSFCSMLGYQRDELIGMNVSQWDAGFISQEEMFAAFRKQFEIPVRSLFESRHKRKNGTIYDVEISGFPLKLDGKPVLFNSSRDITDRKQFDLAIRESEERFRTMADAAPVLNWLAGLDKLCYWFNKTWLDFTGRSLEQEMGNGWAEGVHPDDFQDCLETYVNAFDARKEFVMYYRLRRFDGEYRWIVDHGLPRIDDEGYFHGYLGSCVDITDIKNALNQSLQISKEQQVMLDNELIGIVKVRDRLIMWKNKAMERIFGYEPSEMDGISTRLFYPDDASYQAFGEEAYSMLNSTGVYRKQIEMLRKSGERIWVDISGALLITGIHKESLWMIADITTTKRLSDEMAEIAFHDILTGLPNRLLLGDRLNQMLAQAKRMNQRLAVCYLDLDGFKPVNDQYGHAAGDRLLIEIAGRMQASIRSNDTAGRLGGDEFVLLLTNLVDTEEYKCVLERVMESIRTPILIDESNQVSVGVSIGVTLFPEDNVDADTLLRHADQAMYHAKNAGRNCVHLFTSVVIDEN